jgi:hypothetical protein
VDSADGLGVAACPNVVVAGHGHGAEAYAGDIESADRDVLHGDVLLTGVVRDAAGSLDRREKGCQICRGYCLKQRFGVGKRMLVAAGARLQSGTE